MIVTTFYVLWLWTTKNNIKVNPDANVPDFIKQAIIGLMLGHGTLVFGAKAGTYFKYAPLKEKFTILIYYTFLIYLTKLNYVIC